MNIIKQQLEFNPVTIQEIDFVIQSETSDTRVGSSLEWREQTKAMVYIFGIELTTHNWPFLKSLTISGHMVFSIEPKIPELLNIKSIVSVEGLVRMYQIALNEWVIKANSELSQNADFVGLSLQPYTLSQARDRLAMILDRMP